MQSGTITKLVRVPPLDNALENGGYGIIRGKNGHIVYFVNSVVRGCRFDDLASGQDVQFSVEDGLLRQADTVIPSD